MSTIVIDNSPPSDKVFANSIQRRKTTGPGHAASAERGYESQRVSTLGAIQMGRRQAWYDFRTGLPLVAADAVAAAAAAGVAMLCGFGTASLASPWFALTVVALSLILHHVHGLYPACGMTYAIEFRRIIKTSVMACVAIGIGILFATGIAGFPWLGWAALCVSLTLSLSATRPMVRRWLSRRDWWAQPVVVVGNGERAARLVERLRHSRIEGVRPVGVVFDPAPHWLHSPPNGQASLVGHDSPGGHDSDSDEAAERRKSDFENSYRRELQWCQSLADRGQGSEQLHVGPLGALEEVMLEAGACRIVIAQRSGNDGHAFQQFHGIPHVAVPTEIQEHPTEAVRLIEADGKIELHCRTTLTCPKALFTKRLMDLALVIGSAPFWLPVMGIIALAIKIMDPGPVFYRQTRVGRFREPFQAMKFRSMVCNADEKLKDYLDSHPQMKAEWDATHKLRDDPRVTWIGNFLRKSSLDELPQLLNVLSGEMSLVGPRPIIDCGNYDREYIQEFPEVFEMYQMVRPGITGLWQVSGRNDTSYQQRIHFDRIYLHNWSVTGDIFILWRTIKTALFREGAC